MEGLGIVFVIVICIVFVFIMRWLGAWMLRIDEVIDLQKDILKELKKTNEQQKKNEPVRINNVCRNCGTLIKPNETECSKCGLKG